MTIESGWVFFLSQSGIKKKIFLFLSISILSIYMPGFEHLFESEEYILELLPIEDINYTW